jgi:hypothetical protein
MLLRRLDYVKRFSRSMMKEESLKQLQTGTRTGALPIASSQWALLSSSQANLPKKTSRPPSQKTISIPTQTPI